MTGYYTEKDPSYFAEYREDILNVLKVLGPFDRVLEIGCGNGGLLSRLKRDGLARVVVGLDPYGEVPVDSNLDKFYRDSIENVLRELDQAYRFDLLIFADVLEHLEDPWSILEQMVRDHAAAGGTIIISIPNFRNLLTLSRIVFGNSFRYEQQGVLDKTHLRFFCKKDLIALAEGAGLRVEQIAPNFRFKHSVFFRRNRLRYLNMLSLNLFPFWISDQMIAVTTKPVHTH